MEGVGKDYGKDTSIGREERQIRGILEAHHIWRLNKLMKGAVTTVFS